MTDKNKIEVIVVLDRSGSMMNIKSDMEGGFKSFIEEQAKLPGKCLVSLYQFDHEYEMVFEKKDVNKLEGITLTPRGNTALLDAVGRTINTVGERLASTLEKHRPGSVVFLVITDGHENASREFTKEKVRSMIEHQTSVYNWQFAYLGADFSTFGEALTLGISVNNTYQYTADSKGVGLAYTNLSAAVGVLRSATMKSTDNQPVSLDMNATNVKDDRDGESTETV